jgi:hypothetical protein
MVAYEAPPAGIAARAIEPVRRPGTPQRLAVLYERHLVEAHREDRFLTWISFSLSFLGVRFVTHSIRDRRFTRIFRNVQGKGGRHIHHLVFGIAGLLATGYISTGRHPRNAWARRLLAIGYGASAALTIDEFALWLDLEDVYWARQGRISVDAAILTAAAMGAGVEGRDLFRALGRDSEWLVRHAIERPDMARTGRP